MKILIDCHTPFLLAHGGAQIQIEQTKLALEKIGVAVEYLRWYDENQSGDVLQFFGRLPGGLIKLAHQKGMKVAQMELLTAQGSRSRRRIQMESMARGAVRSLFPGLYRKIYPSDAYQMADACIALTAWEKELMTALYGGKPDKIHVVPNGVEEVFLNGREVERGPWLICTATVVERKKVLELAQAAVQAQTPLWIVGKPYSESDDYARRFVEFARRNEKLIRYEGQINDREKLAGIYSAARGFVLISTMESHSLSAEEAAACGCPLLLRDLPWARTVFQNEANYCENSDSTGVIAHSLRKFYDAAPSLPRPRKPKSWTQVAYDFKAVYETILDGAV